MIPCASTTIFQVSALNLTEAQHIRRMPSENYGELLDRRSEFVADSIRNSDGYLMEEMEKRLVIDPPNLSYFGLNLSGDTSSSVSQYNLCPVITAYEFTLPPRHGYESLCFHCKTAFYNATLRACTRCQMYSTACYHDSQHQTSGKCIPAYTGRPVLPSLDVQDGLPFCRVDSFDPNFVTKIFSLMPGIRLPHDLSQYERGVISHSTAHYDFLSGIGSLYNEVQSDRIKYDMMARQVYRHIQRYVQVFNLSTISQVIESGSDVRNEDSIDNCARSLVSLFNLISENWSEVKTTNYPRELVSVKVQPFSYNFYNSLDKFIIQKQDLVRFANNRGLLGVSSLAPLSYTVRGLYSMEE